MEATSEVYSLPGSPVRGKAQADSRVRARCSGYWRASGCTGRGEASGSRECRARACGAKTVIVIVHKDKRSAHTTLNRSKTGKFACSVQSSVRYAEHTRGVEVEGQAEGVVPPRPEGQLRSTRVDPLPSAPAKWVNLSLRPCTGSSGGG